MHTVYKYILVALTLISVGNWMSINWWAPNLTVYFIEQVICFIGLLYPIFINRNILDIRKVSSFSIYNVFVLYTIILSFYAIIKYAGEGERSDLAGLLSYNMAMLLCVSVYIFSYPYLLCDSCNKLFKFLPFIAIIYMPFAKEGLFGDLMGFLCFPSVILLIFYKILPKRHKIIWLALVIVIIMTSYFGDARSNVIKYLVALLLGFTITWDKFYYRIRHFVWLFVITPFILFILGVTNIFNVFEIDKYINRKDINEEMIADTRTIVYSEALSSAVRNGYVITGRGIGNGYESKFQRGRTRQDKNATAISSSERHAEVGILNIFTWGGVIYIVLYTAMFCSVIYHGIYKSRNSYIRALAFYLAFYYMYSWVENFQSFSIMFIISWAMLAMCLSPYLRRMNNKTFENFIIKMLQ